MPPDQPQVSTEGSQDTRIFSAIAYYFTNRSFNLTTFANFFAFLVDRGITLEELRDFCKRYKEQSPVYVMINGSIQESPEYHLN